MYAGVKRRRKGGGEGGGGGGAAEDAEDESVILPLQGPSLSDYCESMLVSFPSMPPGYYLEYTKMAMKRDEIVRMPAAVHGLSNAFLQFQ